MLRFTRTWSVLWLSAMVIRANGQEPTSDGASITPSLPSVTPSPTADQQQQNIDGLVSAAYSLLSQVYPSTTITNFADVTWPSTLTAVGPTSTPITTSAATAVTSEQPSPSSSHSSGTSDHSYRDVAIILGTVLGFLSLALILTMVLLCIRRSRRGSLFHRSVTPLDDAEIESWRKPRTAPQWHDEKSASMPTYPPPAAGSHRKYYSIDDEATLDANPFISPAYIYRTPSLRSLEDSHRKSSTSLHGRPSLRLVNSFEGSTYYHSSPSSRVRESGHSRNRSSMSFQDRSSTQFSPVPSEDSESAPGVPRKNPKRFSSRIHYPSMSETYDFDFGFYDRDSYHDPVSTSSATLDDCHRRQ